MRTLVTLVVTLVIVMIIGCVRYEPYPNGRDRDEVTIHHHVTDNGK